MLRTSVHQQSAIKRLKRQWSGRKDFRSIYLSKDWFSKYKKKIIKKAYNPQITQSNFAKTGRTLEQELYKRNPNTFEHMRRVRPPQ